VFSLLLRFEPGRFPAARREAARIEFRVINIAANGPVVMTERVDVFKLPNKSFELQVMGTFEVSGGRISAWRDYFAMNQFTSRMG
jgi:limonene-1,2-epoxide hydrolase